MFYVLPDDNLRFRLLAGLVAVERKDRIVIQCG